MSNLRLGRSLPLGLTVLPRTVVRPSDDVHVPFPSTFPFNQPPTNFSPFNHVIVPLFVSALPVPNVRALLCVRRCAPHDAGSSTPPTYEEPSGKVIVPSPDGVLFNQAPTLVLRVWVL